MERGRLKPCFEKGFSDGLDRRICAGYLEAASSAASEAASLASSAASEAVSLASSAVSAAEGVPFRAFRDSLQAASRWSAGRFFIASLPCSNDFCSSALVAASTLAIESANAFSYSSQTEPLVAALPPVALAEFVEPESPPQADNANAANRDASKADVFICISLWFVVEKNLDCYDISFVRQDFCDYLFVSFSKLIGKSNISNCSCRRAL